MTKLLVNLPIIHIEPQEETIKMHHWREMLEAIYIETRDRDSSVFYKTFYFITIFSSPNALDLTVS